MGEFAFAGCGRNLLSDFRFQNRNTRFQNRNQNVGKRRMCFSAHFKSEICVSDSDSEGLGKGHISLRIWISPRLGQSGHPQRAWRVGMGRGGPWRAVGGDPSGGAPKEGLGGLRGGGGHRGGGWCTRKSKGT